LIQQRAKYIEKLNKKYIPFASRLYLLASEYEDEGIVSFVEQFR